jgi:ribA/ribD-fused uncharacterized protein
MTNIQDNIFLGERITDTHIYFWNGIFSNWFITKFTASLEKNGELMDFNCVEQYMMAAKAFTFNDWSTMTAILKSSSPREQKALGRKVKLYNDEVWNKIRFDVVYKGCMEKFSQSPSLKEALINTGDKILVEASPEDPIWGIGLHWNDDDVLNEALWKGQNLLGKVIMKVRNDIKQS